MRHDGNIYISNQKEIIYTGKVCVKYYHIEDLICSAHDRVVYKSDGGSDNIVMRERNTLH